MDSNIFDISDDRPYQTLLNHELFFYISKFGPKQWRSQEFELGGNMASAEREPVRGSDGGAPSGVQGQSPWSRGRGLCPLKLATFCILTSMISA
jgi:hypothetical protein